MLFRQVFDPHLAQYAYLIGCQQTGEALVIDPQRDVERYIDLAAAEGLTIVAVAETHIHADFLSGARELAERLPVTLYLSDAGGDAWRYRWARDSKYDFHPLRDGDRFHIGKIEIRAAHTPGHTPEHMSFVVVDQGGGADEPMGIATGDFVFVGDLGRPDLLESAAGQVGAMEPSARTLYRTVGLLGGFADHLQVWPGHGAGSACGKALGAVPMSTVGYERRFNAAIAAAARGEDAFVAAILDGQPEPPLYFGRMKRLNKEGPAVLGSLPCPARLDGAGLAAAGQRGDAVVVDTRQDRAAFMEGHLPGALYAPFGKTFSAIVGSYVEPETAIYLVIEEGDVDAAVRDLVRIGLDRVAGFTTPAALALFASRGGRLVSTPVVDFAGARPSIAAPDHVPLDVRRAAEFAQGAVPGALNIAHTRLLDRLDEVPTDRTLLVYCRSGARAAAASAFLERAGRRVIYVEDHIERWHSVA